MTWTPATSSRLYYASFIAIMFIPALLSMTIVHDTVMSDNSNVLEIETLCLGSLQCICALVILKSGLTLALYHTVLAIATLVSHEMHTSRWFIKCILLLVCMFLSFVVLPTGTFLLPAFHMLVWGMTIIDALLCLTQGILCTGSVVQGAIRGCIDCVNIDGDDDVERRFSLCAACGLIMIFGLETTLMVVEFVIFALGKTCPGTIIGTTLVLVIVFCIILFMGAVCTQREHAGIGQWIFVATFIIVSTSALVSGVPRSWTVYCTTETIHNIFSLVSTIILLILHSVILRIELLSWCVSMHARGIIGMALMCATCISCHCISKDSLFNDDDDDDNENETTEMEHMQTRKGSRVATHVTLVLASFTLSCVALSWGMPIWQESLGGVVFQSEAWTFWVRLTLIMWWLMYYGLYLVVPSVLRDRDYTN